MINGALGEIARLGGGSASVAAESIKAERARTRAAQATTREFQRQEREKLRTVQATARAAAREYERELGQSFFARLGRSASDSFKRNFSVSGIGGGAGIGGAGGLLGGVGSVLGGNILTSVLGGITSQITGGIKAGFDFNKIKEQSLLGFEIKLGGRDEALSFFRQIEKFTAEAPQELNQVLESTQRLMSAFKPQEALVALSAITDAVAYQGKVGGEAQESINGIGTALSQVLYKNKLSAEEMVQLAERQVNGYKYLAAEIAKTDRAFAALTDEEKQGRVMDMAQKNLLNAKTAVAVIIRGMQAEFGGTAARLAKETAAGMESNISDSLNRTAGIASESAFQEYKRFLDRTLGFLNTGASERIAGNISASTGALFSGFEKTLGAISSGNLGQLGLDAVSSAAEGVKAGAKGLYDAGAGAAGRLEDGWRDRLIQHSPSQLLLGLGFEAGQSLVTGFIQGVEGTKISERIEKVIREAAEKFRLPPDLIKEVIYKESGFKPRATSPVGAMGLMQLMPDTAAGLGVKNPYNIEENVMGGAKYLRQLLDQFGNDVRLALAAYNAGPGAVLAHLPNRPDVNSYVGGSGKRWTVSEEAAQRAQGIPQNAQTRDYVASIMGRLDALGLAYQTGGASAPLPVRVVNTPDFSGFPGTPYSPDFERLSRGSDTPASRDLQGGTGRFAGPGNQRAFMEWLYAAEQASAASERTSVEAQSQHRQRVALMARELDVSQNFVRLAQDHIARLLEIQRQLSGASGGSFQPGSPFANTTDEQARHVLEMMRRARGEGVEVIRQSAADLAQTVTPQALVGVRLVAEEAKGAFENLPPLIKESTRDMEDFAKTVSGMLGGLFQSALRGRWRDGLRGLLDDFTSWTASLFESWLQSGIVKAFSGQGGAAGAGGGAASGAGGGNFLGSLWGGIKNLFGGGSSSASGGIGIPSSASRGPWVDPSAFTSQFGNAPGLSALGGGGSFGFGATKFNALLPMLGAQLGGGLVSAIAGPQAGGLAGMLGMAGGGLLGVGLTGAPAALGGSFLAPLFSNPITAIVGGALLVGGILYGRNKQRQADERTRNTISNDTGTQIWSLIDRARSLTTSQVEQEWAQIEKNYQQQTAQIKDGKTKRNAQLQWTRDFLPLKQLALTRAKEGEKAKAFRDEFIPTFSTGGMVAPSFTGRVPGTFDRKDDKLVRVSGDETILTPLHRARLGGHTAMMRAGVPGYADGVTLGGGGAPGGATYITLRVELGKGDRTRIVMEELRSADARAQITEAVLDHVDREGMDGLLGAITLGLMKRGYV